MSTKKIKDDPFNEILEELNVIKQSITSVTSRLKVLKRTTKVRDNSNVKSGFVKPVSISQQLADFLDVKSDELVSRNVVNKSINDYIVKNNLQVPEFKQTFVLDSKLAVLFDLPEQTQVNYFKMQTYMKRHYPKKKLVDPPDHQ